jgi:hypothetical protein
MPSKHEALNANSSTTKKKKKKKVQKQFSASIWALGWWYVPIDWTTQLLQRQKQEDHLSPGVCGNTSRRSLRQNKKQYCGSGSQT